MYESADQAEPVYDAKGIETVRRDSIPAVSKVHSYWSLLFLKCILISCSCYMYFYWSLNSF